MQVFMTLLRVNIACNMQNMQNNMHDMQNMQMLFAICRICTAHFADGRSRLLRQNSVTCTKQALQVARGASVIRTESYRRITVVLAQRPVIQRRPPSPRHGPACPSGRRRRRPPGRPSSCGQESTDRHGSDSERTRIVFSALDYEGHQVQFAKCRKSRRRSDRDSDGRRCGWRRAGPCTGATDLQLACSSVLIAGAGLGRPSLGLAASVMSSPSPIAGARRPPGPLVTTGNDFFFEKPIF
jgi:hypothetical protein